MTAILAAIAFGLALAAALRAYRLAHLLALSVKALDDFVAIQKTVNDYHDNAIRKLTEVAELLNRRPL